MRAFTVCLFVAHSKAAYLKLSSNDPGAYFKTSFSRCPTVASPVGLTKVVLTADSFLARGFPTTPIASNFLTSDKAHLSAAGQDTLCNASKIPLPMKGKWVFQTSLAYNLCGVGYGITGVWKGDRSMWLKTLEATGAAGTTIFLQTIPEKWGGVVEACTGNAMPVTTSSIIHYHQVPMKTGGKAASFLIKPNIMLKMKKPMLVSFPGEENEEAGFYAGSYAIAVVSGVIAIATSLLSVVTLLRSQKKATLFGVVLAYESIAGIVRGVILFLAGPLTYGPAVYTGVTAENTIFFVTLLGPLGTPSTFLTSVVWLRFTLFRATVPIWFDICSLLAFLAVTAGVWSASLVYPISFMSAGVLQSGLQGSVATARALSYQVKVPFSLFSFALFIASNTLWLSKLRKAASVSDQLLKVAKTCMFIMIFQSIFLVLTIVFDFIELNSTAFSAPLTDATGVLSLSINAIFSAFVNTPSEAVLGLSQVLAIRALSVSSSSSSSSSYTANNNNTNHNTNTKKNFRGGYKLESNAPER